MKEKSQLQVFLLFLFIVVVMGLSQASFASVVLTPQIAGYSAASGRFAAGASGFVMTAANDGYIAQSIINVGGKAVTLPATLRMAANAGQLALTGMRLSPWGIVGTLAAGWLLNEGLQYINGQWQISVTEMYIDAYPPVTGTDKQDMCQRYFNQVGQSWCSVSVGSADPYAGVCRCNGADQATIYFGNSSTRPAIQSDWDALPDPVPVVAPELPYAPYMPDGAPVNKPEFAPADVPLGNPYTKPDGSTAQPRAKISPSGDGQVTVSTYDQPLTDAQGQPVSNPTPQPTPDPPKDPCDGHPDRLGCMDAGSDNFSVPKSSVALAFTPEAAPFSGTCPAPINVLGQSISFQSSCDAMTMIRPLVLAFAAVMAAFILLDTFRGAA